MVDRADHLGRSLAVLVLLAVILLADRSYAREAPLRDSREGVLDASLVVIVRKHQADDFRIEEVMLGPKKVGDLITVPNFRLYTVQERGPEKVEPITPQTRILLFLRPKARVPDALEVTGCGYCFFWVHEPGNVAELRRIAEKAVGLRRSWEKARDIRDQQKRVEALWPYLWDHGRSFLEHSRKELQKTGAVAGDYIAERLPNLSHRQRMTLLPRLGAWGGERLHAAVIAHLKQQQKLFEAILVELGPNARDLWEDWDKVPDTMKEAYGELYYGLTGLASFKDRKDLEFVRGLALWAVDRRCKDSCDAALAAFRAMPHDANLPVIEAIWREFSSKQYAGNKLLPFGVIRTLRAQKHLDAVPLLAELLANKEAGAQARAALCEIVGEDLGEDADAWLKWYAQHKRGSSEGFVP